MAKVECELITQDAIDVEIGSGLGAVLQVKSVEITENGTAVVKPDDGFDGLQVVEINTNTPENITGVIGAKDGMSLAQLLCSASAASSVTEIVDDNTGWTALYDTNVPAEYLVLGTLFPNIRRVVLNVSETNYRIRFVNAEEIILHTDKIISQWLANQNIGFIYAPNAKVYADELTSATYGINYGSNLTFLAYCKEIYLRGIKSINVRIAGNGNYNPLKKVVFNTIDYMYEHGSSSQTNYFNFMGCVDLIHIEFGNWGGTVNASISLKGWSPTNALDVSRTDLIEEGSTATNNLQQFLSNFKTYIAERLTDKGKGLTLTLSQEVRNAIHAAEDEYGIENIIITKKGWTISPAPN